MFEGEDLSSGFSVGFEAADGGHGVFRAWFGGGFRVEADRSAGGRPRASIHVAAMKKRATIQEFRD